MFAHAPPPLVIGGRLAVPIHIDRLTATVALDARTRCGQVDAVLGYQLGPTSGCALFDLRQSIDQAWLDGRPIATASLRAREVGEGPAATMRMVDRPQAARSRHMLRLKYRLAQPLSDLGGAYPPVLEAQSPRRLRWSFGMGDLFDGRHLEMWFPSNLPFDQFPFELDLRVTGATDHTLITNGAVSARGGNCWHISFPAWFSGLSPMVEVRPTDELEHARAAVVLAEPAGRVDIDVWKSSGRPESLPDAALRVAGLLADNQAMFGPYPADRFTCLFHDAEGGMEYAGATTTSSGALDHEVLHSWFARGVMPASDTDGWWDEAFTTYLTSGAAAGPLDFGRPPVELCSRRPFQRHTCAAAYGEGSRLFSGIAEMTGRDVLLRSMRRLFRSWNRRCLSTAELEQHLVRDTGVVEIVDAFHRFVYGFDDSPGGSAVRFDELRTGAGPDGRPWIVAQVSNDRDAQLCRHFLLLFSVAGTSAARTAPAHVASVAGFDLRPGQRRTLRVPLPIAQDSAGEVDIGDVDIVGAVHTRWGHPAGQAGHRNRTMMRLRSRTGRLQAQTGSRRA